MEEFKVSVIVPAFDELHLLSEWVDAFKRQSVSPEVFEILLVCDGGPESYPAWREAICKVLGPPSLPLEAAVGVRFPHPFSREPWRFSISQGSRLHLQYIETGLPQDVYGVTVARNLGVRQARANLLIFTDADCLPNKYFVQSHLEAHGLLSPLGERGKEKEKTQEIAVIGYKTDKKEAIHGELPLPVETEKGRKLLLRSRAGTIGPGQVHTGNLSLLKKTVVRVGGFNEVFAQKNLYGYDDREFALRLQYAGIRFVFCPNAVCYHEDVGEPELLSREAKRQRGYRLFKKIQRRLRWRAFWSSLWSVHKKPLSFPALMEK